MSLQLVIKVTQEQPGERTMTNLDGGNHIFRSRTNERTAAVIFHSHTYACTFRMLRP